MTLNPQPGGFDALVLGEERALSCTRKLATAQKRNSSILARNFGHTSLDEPPLEPPTTTTTTTTTPPPPTPTPTPTPTPIPPTPGAAALITTGATEP